uniref:lymphocyte expansion molecule-like isoform X2 n=1 Tax=Oncorhynchus gorbuscha TaxID=8017 RepID=UPI001EAEA38F|nr:lymphocyte expansion molecule-like isoform X2 [Oncorhynchus gorbuscha]
MAEKKFKGAPFGTQTSRFDVSAVHPANKRVGTYTEISYCKKMTNDLERRLGPGSYDAAGHGDFSKRSVAERAKGPGWQRAQETARLAAIPHLLYREAWENKRFLKTKVGPGTYRVADFIEELQKKPGSVRGVCDSREERFRNAQSWTPGPGCYGNGGIPWAALEEKRSGLNGAPSMHLGSSLQRFPEGNSTDCGLSPCTYTLKSSTEVLLASGSSRRGAYDLFTGPRDKPITAGYFATPGSTPVGVGALERSCVVVKSGTTVCLECWISTQLFQQRESTTAPCPNALDLLRSQGQAGIRSSLHSPAQRVTPIPPSSPLPPVPAVGQKDCRTEIIAWLVLVVMTLQKRGVVRLTMATPPPSVPGHRDIFTNQTETNTHRRGCVR